MKQIFTIFFFFILCASFAQTIKKQSEYPQRFGFPVFVILDSVGKRIHTQNSAYLEEGEGYSKKKVLDFLTNWSPEVLNPNLYLDK